MSVRGWPFSLHLPSCSQATRLRSWISKQPETFKRVGSAHPQLTRVADPGESQARGEESKNHFLNTYCVPKAELSLKSLVNDPDGNLCPGGAHEETNMGNDELPSQAL